MADELKQVIINCETLEKIEILYGKKGINGKELQKAITELVDNEYKMRIENKRE